MGLFSLFKSRKSTHEKKVLKAYQCFKPDMVELIYPGKVHQADKIIVSLGKILNINLETAGADCYLELLKIYVDVLTRKVVTPMSDEGIIESLQKRHNELIKSPMLAKKVLMYTMLNMANHEFAIESQAEMDLVSIDIAGDYSEKGPQSKRDAIFAGQRPLQEDYGYSCENPICTFSIGSSKKYLSRLRTTDGSQLYWTRLGSLSLKECNGVQNVIVDVYQLYLHGKEYAEIYICPYAKDCENVPKGMVLCDADNLPRKS